MSKEKVGAYGTHQREMEDPRETDRRALLTCAAQLKTAIDNGGKDMKAYGDAIRLNQRLWTIFQVAVCDPDSPLPRDLRTNLLNLSRYVDRVSFRAVTEFAPQLLHSLIDINRALATGLGMKPQGERKAPAVEMTAQPSAVVFNATA